MKYARKTRIGLVQLITCLMTVKLFCILRLRILPYLGQLKGKFTSYKLEHIGKMT